MRIFVIRSESISFLFKITPTIGGYFEWMKDFNVVGQFQSFDKRILDAATELVNFIHGARVFRQPIHVILKYVYAHGSIQANVLHHRRSIATVIPNRFDYVRFVIGPVESIVHKKVNGETIGRVQVIADE